MLGFNVGDRVAVIQNFRCDGVDFYKGETGTLLEVKNWCCVEWDREYTDFHNGDGTGRQNHCYYVWIDNLKYHVDKNNNISEWLK